MSHDHSQNHYGPNASFDGYDSDLASAGILIESLRQQLSAALAACKQKDEALEGLIDTMDLRLDDDDLSLETRTAFETLAIQPDDAALKAWLGEPVAWLHENRPEADVITDAVKNVWTGVVVGKDSVYSIPLYAPKGLK